MCAGCEQLAESGTFAFSDPDDFRGGLRRAGIEMVLTVSGDFKAHQTYVELSQLSLVCSWEERPRVAYLSLAPDRVFITSAAHSSGPIRWGGLELQPGDIVFHSRGERMHQRTSGPWHWESISQTPQHLAACIKNLIGTDLVAPQAAQVLRLPASILAPARRLHADACRLVEKKPELIALPAVAHALEQDLIYALVTCLSGPDRQHSAPKRYRADHAPIRRCSSRASRALACPAGAV